MSAFILLQAICWLVFSQPNHTSAGAFPLFVNQGSANPGSTDRGRLRFSPSSIKGEALINGVKLGFSFYKASDGVTLEILYNNFADADLATQVFDKQLAAAAKIVSRGLKLNRVGKVVGERAQVVIPGNKPNETISAVLWTDGPQFREINAPSLADVLELEKVYK